jgi:membrane-bound lytic murein transglycosylase
MDLFCGFGTTAENIAGHLNQNITVYAFLAK